MAILSDIFRFWQREDTKDADQEKEGKISFAIPDERDGATEVEAESRSMSGLAGFSQMMLGTVVPNVRTTTDLINAYRSLSEFHEVDNAIQEIVFEAIVVEKDRETVVLNLENTNFSENIKKRIHEEFQVVLNLLNFDHKGASLFRRWYVDSRIFFHKILHKDPKKGIQELRLLDPRKMELVREVEKKTVDNIDYITKVTEYFMYDNMPKEAGVNNNMNLSNGSKKLKLPRNMVTYAHSGLTDSTGKNIISYLHKAQKPANQLKMLEDALVIYRITRAPERRIFYIDVGNMPPTKAEQYTNNMMQSLKNRVVYDTTTGKVKNQYNNMSMTEDYFLMRRDGKTSAEITTLPGAQNMGAIDDVQWFNKKLYEALHIPLSRIPNEGGGVTFGNGSEITRDEIKFGKFIGSLLAEFREVLLDPLRTNLVLKGIITDDEWKENENRIKCIFNKDSYFEETIQLEQLTQRMNIMAGMAPYVGRYVSNDYIMRHIFKMSEDEIQAQRKLIEEESSDPIFSQPILDEEQIPEEF